MTLVGCVKVPEPSVKEGRFDFSVTYEVDDEIITYSGVYVCKYEGAYVSLVGDGRDWSGYVEGCLEEIAIDNNEDGVIYIG